MNRLIILLCLASLLIVPVLAAETAEDAETLTGGVRNEASSQNGTAPEAAAQTDPGDPLASVPAAVEPASTVAVLDAAPVLDDDAPGTLRQAVAGVFGEYQPRTQTVTEYASDGSVLRTETQLVPGLAGLDWAWIASAVFFALFILGFFKLLGGLIRS